MKTIEQSINDTNLILASLEKDKSEALKNLSRLKNTKSKYDILECSM